MFKQKVLSPERKLDLPVYSLGGEKSREPKSTFIDSNRIDTVRLAQLNEKKYYKNSIIGNDENKDCKKLILEKKKGK